ncbi:MAG: hypothetical protein MUF52_13775 [Syntrophobacteraceae bacterium]|jgi:hypothetical protein|nr:hypothetical protein [Syntrophobacteraceae bacterium]
MRRINRLLRQTELHFFLFLLGFVSLNWPILNIFYGNRPESIIAYFFSIWALVIVILFFVQRACGAEAPESAREEPF